jgi:tetratricopeptide (TPR) repeat protein
MSNNSVQVWEEKVTIPTYGIGKPDKNPMFFEKRVYQGSSGAVYPNAVIEKIYDEKVDKTYNAVFIENKYLKIMILPELGGRIQRAYDKLKQRDFIYYNQVIKPALVGLTGPWISGGIEFNWPQHHRPSTFEPVDFTIEENTDGSKTVWVNEIERMFGTKGMAGFTLHPDKAYIEIKAKLYNRTSLPQTFLWWANPAVKVNDDYQSVFPPDVNAVFDHGKRDVSTFPIATGTYYKVDYSPGTDISRYKNIPVPTSYMAINSDYDFVGGYEHDTQAGLLHVANHHVSPGKKQWTWGYSDFGQAWDRNLTDEDGPYIELMTGVFTDNQPDFSWLMPYEEKTFTQYFMPYRELGMVKNATKDILVGMEHIDGRLIVQVFATSLHANVQVILKEKDRVLRTQTTDLSPEQVYENTLKFNREFSENDMLLIVLNADGRELIRYQPSKSKQNAIPEPAKPALQPKDVENNEQLFLTAQHLDQYRHATYSPVPYYEEALRRDPKDIRNNNALGAWYLRRGQFATAEPYFRKAVETSISRNPNPYDSEAYYNLGLCFKYQGKQNDAYNAFYKATWSNAWQDSAYFSVAQIDTARGDYELALEHINWAIDKNARNNKAYVLKAIILRKQKKYVQTIDVCTEALKRDSFNLGALFEKTLSYKELSQPDEARQCLDDMLKLSRKTAHNLTEYALEYAAAGLYREAAELLGFTPVTERSPLVFYHLAYFAGKLNAKEKVKTHLDKAKNANPYLCFPNKLEDILALQYAITQNPEDAKAPYYLGNLWYDKRQYTEAIACWELSVKKDSSFPTVNRNLGIAYFNKQNDTEKALLSFEKAFKWDKTDARVLMELDQLYKRLNHDPQQRLKFLESNLRTVSERDDLYLERAAMYNFIGKHKKAYDLIMSRQFHPWEGGEGKVSGQYMYSLVEIAKQHIEKGDFSAAIAQLEQAQAYPHNLGEGKLYGAQENDIFYWLGCAYEGLAEHDTAKAFFKNATIGLSEPGAAMFYNDQQPDKIYYQGLAWQKLGENQKAITIFNNLVAYANTHMDDDVKLDYFAVSLPNLLVFEDDLNLRNKVHCLYILGLGLAGIGDTEASASALNKVLQYDAMHFGAKTHVAGLLHHSK